MWGGDRDSIVAAFGWHAHVTSWHEQSVDSLFWQLLMLSSCLIFLDKNKLRY